MKKLLTLILLSGVFLFGYYVGRLPGAPDLVPYAQKTYHQAAAAYRCVDAFVRQEIEKRNAASPQHAAVTWGGQTDSAEQEGQNP
jgi:hypothetical protein